MKLNNIMGEKENILKRKKKLQRWRKLRERLERGGIIVSEITDAAISLIPEREASDRVNVANDTTMSAAPEKERESYI